MPRTPRRLLVDLGSTNHCTWRSHNFSRVLEDDDAKRFFLALLQKYAPRHGILVRSYCLMGTHPHVVVVATLHPHVHMLVADGAWYERADGTLRFEDTPPPTLHEVATLAERIAHRLTKMFHRRGLTVRPDEDPPPATAPDPLADCIQVALGLGHREGQEPALAIAADEPPRPGPRDPPLCAIAQGVNVHAGVVVPAGDRAALERLLRYLLRPALSLRRLSLRDDDVVVYRLQRPDRRGRTALVMTPQELLARLSAILPAPRLALRRQLGVFSPGSPDRRKIMPASVPSQGCHPARSAPTRVPWAELLRRVWHIEALRCERCGGRLRPVALVQDLAEAERYLRQRGEFTPVPGPHVLAARRPRLPEHETPCRTAEVF